MFSQKYAKIITSITLFILLDLILFGLNHFSTRQFEIDTKNINRASELRMLSQQLTKSLLTLQNEIKTAAPTQSSLTELQESRDHFDENIRALQTAFTSADNDDSSPAIIASNIKKINKEWLQWKDGLSPLFFELGAHGEAIDFAATKLNTKNVYLLALCDDLTLALENKISQQNTRTKSILVSILFIAILNFIYIVFIFIKALDRSDNEASLSQLQKNRILSAVNEGLLLIHPDGKIAKEMSQSIHRHFGKKIHSHTSFIDLFDEHLVPTEKDKISKYIALNLSTTTSISMLKQLHPLKEIKLLVNGNYKYLSFDFAQIIENNLVAELLVTVTDVTDMALLKSKALA